MRTRSALATGAALAALAAGLLAGCTDDDGPPAGADRTATDPSGTAGAGPDGDTVSASVDAGSQTAAHLLVRGGAKALAFTTDADDGSLVSATAHASRSDPAFSTVDGDDGAVGSTHALDVDGGQVAVRLDADVDWTIEIEAGVEQLEADLTGTTLEGFRLANGASSGTLLLGEPDGVVPLEQTAGLSSLAIQVPDDAGLRWTTSAGAGTADILGDTSQGISSGTELTTPGLDTSDPYYDLRSAAGLGSLVVTHP
ncbi:hypothetical protein [Cellulomonas sp. PhB143]|uniref:hypothetical protein n=1 Tax=Cellulomonas sp. PhB143 TaxID=2485186 RepID=UPI000F49FC15|nr:hypothetical protein [Cellulomonas sp. PhB143]ROS76555.1 hypothetical protein EDF32_1374 [Cellulomonas sp. PhB143]